MEKLSIEFTGNGVPRSVFISRFSEEYFGFIPKEEPLSVPFFYLLREMAKNIYDHAEGKGCVELGKNGRNVSFEVSDQGKEPYDFAALMEKIESGSLKRGDRVNFGIGLRSIHKDSKFLGIDLFIDTSSGFLYRGTLNLDFEPKTGHGARNMERSLS